MSDEDIGKGTAWFSTLQRGLSNAHHCIICVTQENVRSEWLYFEAGVIAAKGDGVLICPYLVGVEPSALSAGPLGQYQCTVATKDDTHRLVRDLNDALGEKRHHRELVDANFEVKWPELELALGLKSRRGTTTSAVVISGDARKLLLEAVNDKHGRVARNRTMYGLTISTNGRDFVAGNDPKEEARWTHALSELAENKFLEPVTPKGEVFQVTKRGYDLAESLEPRDATIAAQSTGFSEGDIVSLLEEYLGAYKSKLGDKAFSFGDVDKAVGLPDGSAEKWLAEAAKKFGYLVDRKGDQTIKFRPGFSTTPSVVVPKGPRF
jgi:hypothetical protein